MQVSQAQPSRRHSRSCLQHPLNCAGAACHKSECHSACTAVYKLISSKLLVPIACSQECTSFSALLMQAAAWCKKRCEQMQLCELPLSINIRPCSVYAGSIVADMAISSLCRTAIPSYACTEIYQRATKVKMSQTLSRRIDEPPSGT